MSDEVTDKVYQADGSEAELIEIDVEALRAIGRIVTTGIVKEEGCLPHTTGATDTDDPILPIDLIH